MKNMKFILAISLAFLFLFNISVYALGVDFINTEKMSSQLKKELVESKEEKILVSIWLESQKIGCERNCFESSIKDIFNQNENSKLSDRDIQEKIEAVKKEYRRSIKNIYLKKNNEFCDSFLKAEDVVYISKYSPLIIAYIDKRDVIHLSDQKNIVLLDFFPDNEFDEKNTFEEDIDVVANTYVCSDFSYNYTGSGIKIGVLDNRVPNPSYFSGYNIGGTYGDIEYYLHGYYCTKMIMDVAPGATYYLAGGTNDVVIGFVEWLIDQGVDVINWSGGTVGNYYSYDNFTKWFEHICYNHYISFVISSANLGGNGISSPGMSYNLLCVGAVSPNEYTGEYDLYSLFYSGSILASKPDICSLGTQTSYAAPAVTGTIALMIEADYNLIYSPELIKAILTAAVDTDPNYRFVPTFRSTNTISYMQFGAGILDTGKAIELTESGNTIVQSMDSTHSEYFFNLHIYSYMIGSTFRVSTVFSVPTNFSINSEHLSTSNTSLYCSVPNLDLEIYEPNSSVPLAISATTFNNIEIVEFSPQVPGTYKIHVVQQTSDTNDVFFGVAWCNYD